MVKTLTAEQWQRFYQHLHHLLNAGLPLVDALALLSEYGVSPVQCDLSRHLRALVMRGTSLTQAARLSQLFGPIDLNLLEVGELSGKLPSTLELLAQHHQRRVCFKAGLHKALAYPVMVCALSVLLLWLVLTWVVPQLAQVFAGFGVSLPWLTRLVIRCAAVAGYLGLVAVLLVIGAGLLLRWLWSRHRCLIEHELQRLPYFGALWRLAVWQRCCQSLGLMLYAGIPLLQALPIGGLASASVLCQTALFLVSHEVQRGCTLSAALGHQDFVPKVLVLLVTLGENSGRLDEVLLQQAALFERQLDDALERLTRWLEPLVMLGVGVLIGLIVIALYLPIFEMGKLW